MTPDELPTEALNDLGPRAQRGPLDHSDLTVMKYKVIAAAQRAAERSDVAALEAVLDSLNDGETAWNQAKMDEAEKAHAALESEER